MNKTKEKILKVSLKLYNDHGVSNVSVRHISKEATISHSNLIYHYPDHESIVLNLHELMLQKAIELNKEMKHAVISLKELYETTKAGFSVVYDFRFFFNDLKYICHTFPKVRHVLISVEQIRSSMYRQLISHLIEFKLMREEEFKDEYAQLITLIKIFGDHWLVSSDIYDNCSKKDKIEKYSLLLMSFFYPYLTVKGKKEYKQMLLIDL